MADASAARLTPSDRELLLTLLELPTAGPLETGPDGPPARLWEAGRTYAAAAAELVFAERGAPKPVG